MPIHFYAEHLVNIRTLTVQASLSTISNKATKASLSADGSILTLSHEGETATIKLPISIPGGHNEAVLTLPAAPTRDLSFRVSLSEKSGSGLLTTGDHEDANIVPWTATSLTPDTEIACKACGSLIIKRGKISIWKDLPSENWAEMMDFWHCHRPDVPHTHHHETPRKGYSADSKLALEPGVGMVDPVDFVFTPNDCQNIRVGTYFLSRFNSLHGQQEPAFPGRKVSFEGIVGIQLSKIEQTDAEARTSLHGWSDGTIMSPSCVSPLRLGGHGLSGI